MPAKGKESVLDILERMSDTAMESALSTAMVEYINDNPEIIEDLMQDIINRVQNNADLMERLSRAFVERLASEIESGDVIDILEEDSIDELRSALGKKMAAKLRIIPESL